jgi:DNA-binding response OmpR family regulator
MATPNTERRANILLVEDEALIRECVSDALTAQGFTVHCAASASEALRLLLTGTPVDILFTDINLAGGTDGGTLAQHVRQLRASLPVIYTTGHRSGRDQFAPVEGAMFVPKPYSPHEIGRLIEYLVAMAPRPRVSQPSQAGRDLALHAT